VAVLFELVILIAGILGAGIAKFYSEPRNRLLRHQYLDYALDADGKEKRSD
jgi:hypothetical protein